MIVEFDFDLDMWVRNLQIEANSVEEAEAKLRKMTLEELISEGAIVKQMDIKDLTSEIKERKVKVQVGNISVEPSFFEYDTEAEKEELQRKVENQVLEFELNLKSGDFIEDEIDSALEEHFEISGTYRYDYKELASE
jgi:hypothetical protein